MPFCQVFQHTNDHISAHSKNKYMLWVLIFFNYNPRNNLVHVSFWSSEFCHFSVSCYDNLSGWGNLICLSVQLVNSAIWHMSATKESNNQVLSKAFLNVPFFQRDGFQSWLSYHFLLNLLTIYRSVRNHVILRMCEDETIYFSMFP